MTAQGNKPRKGQIFVFSSAGGRILGEPRGYNIKALEELGYKVHFLIPPTRLFFLDAARVAKSKYVPKSKKSFHSATAIAQYVAEKSKDYAVNISIGASSGGYAALRYAIENDFKAAIGFSAFTTFDSSMASHDARGNGPDGQKLMEKMHALEPDDRKRNIQHFLDTNDYKGRIHLNYGGRNIGDSFQAKNLEGYPSVTLHPHDTDKHGIFDDTKATFRRCWSMLENDPDAWDRG